MLLSISYKLSLPPFLKLAILLHSLLGHSALYDVHKVRLTLVRSAQRLCDTFQTQYCDSANQLLLHKLHSKITRWQPSHPGILS